MKHLTGKLALFAVALVCTVSASAETTDHGGYPERFKGGGDKIPPECQLDLPRAATSPFFVKWNCSDDNAEPEEIRTELWIYRKGSEAGQLIANFLGFPASVQIDESILQAPVFREGLPVGFKLVAIDRAGITMISPIRTVAAQDNSSLTKCSLDIETEQTPASGSTTGLPALSVLVNDAQVSVRQLNETNFTVTTAAPADAEPCEIDSVCDNDSEVTFQSSIRLEDNNVATGSLSISPGAVLAEMTGTSSVEALELTSLDLSGETTIDGQTAQVTLRCSE